ncbi:MAG: MoaD/ThiS family protein [Candidatus Thiodiazotropha sp. (ex Monitilora ramsayi)]|nr:MoaD/ThiS family protein [Candidatus Thiodiazotropha sp. (ex Monitilora ramsayi)]
MPSLSFTSNLTRHVDCPDAEFDASSVAQLFDLYFTRWPGVRNYVLDDQGAVRNHVIVVVDGHGLNDRRHLRDSLSSDSEVFVFQALSGG